MALFLVSYDLRKQGQDYTKLGMRIAEWGGKRVLESVWALKANTTSAGLYSDLVKYIDSNDRIIVFEGTGAWNTLNSMFDINKL